MSEKRELHLVFGSSSDEEKVLPGIINFSREHPETGIEIIYASADNTPNKVKTFVDSRRARSLIEPFVWMSGAGLSNVLTGVLKSGSGIYDLNLGIPIGDSSSDGVSSFLSTSEKPPRNPVLTVGLNNSYTAINIANRFLDGLIGVAVIGQFCEQGDTDRSRARAVESLVKKLDEVSLPHRICYSGDVSSKEVAINLFGASQSKRIRTSDSLIQNNGAVQLAVPYTNIKSFDIVQYAHLLDTTKATGTVSSYDNAVLMAAILTRNNPVIDKINSEKQAKAKKLEEHQGLLVKGGEVYKQ